MPSEREVRRLQAVCDQQHIVTLADLDAFLAADPKTKDDPEIRALWRQRMLEANPTLQA